MQTARARLCCNPIQLSMPWACICVAAYAVTRPGVSESRHTQDVELVLARLDHGSLEAADALVAVVQPTAAHCMSAGVERSNERPCSGPDVCICMQRSCEHDSEQLVASWRRRTGAHLENLGFTLHLSVGAALMPRFTLKDEVLWRADGAATTTAAE